MIESTAHNSYHPLWTAETELLGVPKPGKADFTIWLSRMRWLIWMRWWATGGLVCCTVLARWIFQINVNHYVLALVALGMIALNLYSRRCVNDDRYHPHLALVQILGDLILLTVTLFFSGGFRNPFFTLYYVQIFLARLLLPRKTGYAVIGLTTILFFSLERAKPAAYFGHADSILAKEYFLHAAGGCVSFVLTALFIAYFVTMLLRELHQRDHQVQLERDRRRLSEKLAALGQLAGGVAHEINTPLSTIQVAAEDTLAQLNEGNNDPHELRHTLSLICEQTRRCSAITRNLLNISRHSGVRAQPVALPPLIRETIDLLRHRAQGIAFEINVTEPIPQVMADPGGVQQILLNLLNNAIDAVRGLPQGCIEIECRAENNHLLVDVTDNGPGIPDSNRVHVFEPFFTTKEVGSGTGLGLAISYGLAKDMDGDLELIQADSGQCRFRLSLPREKQT